MERKSTINDRSDNLVKDYKEKKKNEGLIKIIANFSSRVDFKNFGSKRDGKGIPIITEKNKQEGKKSKNKRQGVIKNVTCVNKFWQRTGNKFFNVGFIKSKTKI